MVELSAKTACEGLLPIEVGQCRLSEVVPLQVTLLSPYKNKRKHLSIALRAAYGVALPAVGRSSAKAGVRCIWFGLDQVMLFGAEPDKSLAKFAAIVDQSDAWAFVRLEGELAESVLARLVPVDVRLAVFKRGYVLRSLLQHLNVTIIRVGVQSFEIIAPRSMAKTLLHDLEGAMRSAAAQT